MSLKSFNQCDCYIIIWLLCQLSGTLNLPSFLTTSLQMLAIFWALFLCNSRFLLRKDQPFLLNVTALAIFLYLLYGFYGMLFGSKTILFSGDIRPPHIYIRTALALALSNAYSTNWLIVKGYEKDARKITVIASLMGFVMAIPLVYFYSYIGAAIVITSSRGIMALLGYRKVRRIKQNLL